MEVVSLQQLDYKMIGKRIQSARKDAHMTQDDLADKCGCTGKYVSNIETGKKTPSLDLLTKISSALEVTVDSSHINSIRFSNLDESVTTMYPLVQPALETIADQIYKTQSLENITCPEENPYTSQVILNAIEDALSKAEKK